MGLAFEHRILAILKQARLKPGGHWLVAVSGGLDSMALAAFLFQWRSKLKIELTLAHVHHGGEDAYRSRARAHVEAWAKTRGLAFVTNGSGEAKAESEASLREFRLGLLKTWGGEVGVSRIVFAHHADDLLETRLIRLVRGTGPEGLVAMRVRGHGVLRPFLHESRAEIEAYARAKGLEWIEDPSNRSLRPLRNWIRTEWLPALEAKRPGATTALARSLELVARKSERAPKRNHSRALRRDEMSRFSFEERERAMTAYLRALGLENYSRSHVLEILKRIDTRRKNLTFRVLGVVFEVTPDFIRASRV